MIWVAIGVGALALLVGVGGIIFVISTVVRVNKVLKKYQDDMATALNTGRGWNKRFNLCREMFTRRMANG